MYVCLHVCVSVNAHVCECMWRLYLDVLLEWWPLYVPRQGLLLTWSSLIQLIQLTNLPGTPLALPPETKALTFKWVLMICTLVLTCMVKTEPSLQVWTHFYCSLHSERTAYLTLVCSSKAVWSSQWVMILRLFLLYVFFSHNPLLCGAGVVQTRTCTH